MINIKFNNIGLKGPLGEFFLDMPFNLFTLTNKEFFILMNKKFFFINSIRTILKSVILGWLLEFTLKGKGFRTFKYKDYLAFDLGYSNLFLFKIRTGKIKLLKVKQKILLFGLNKMKLFNFIFLFKNFYFYDKYHGKGLFFNRNSQLIINKKLM